MRRRRDNGRWEKIMLIVSSVCVLAVLTVVGLFARKGDTDNHDGYVVDFSSMEQNGEELAQNEAVPLATNPKAADSISTTNRADTASGQAGDTTMNTASASPMDGKTIDAASAGQIVGIGEMAALPEMEESAVTENDLDYDPAFRETNSVHVENTADQTRPKEEEKQEEEKEEKQEEAAEDTMAIATSTSIQPALTFGDGDTLAWPVVGNVLINYSMDKTVYFPTLEQYKYNPAIVIAAVEGESITAAASGKVSRVDTDPELGNIVVMELGNGYEITYGQLKDITVSAGGYVNQGDIIGSVAAPTKYYSVEGCNIYLKLTKDGIPVNPMSKLN